VFVIVDECGTNLDLTPRYARAPHGERAYGSVPRNTPPNTTLIGSLSLRGMGPAMLVQGGTDTHTFEAYIEHVLGPSLQPGQVVLIDNLSAHKSPRVSRLIAARGCEVWYLPTYSPDLSPIELAFAKLKDHLRRVGARTAAALEQAVADALPHITAADAKAFFTHCGYWVLSAMAQCFCSPL